MLPSIIGQNHIQFLLKQGKMWKLSKLEWASECWLVRARSSDLYNRSLPGRRWSLLGPSLNHVTQASPTLEIKRYFLSARNLYSFTGWAWANNGWVGPSKILFYWIASLLRYVLNSWSESFQITANCTGNSWHSTWVINTWHRILKSFLFLWKNRLIR